MDGRRPKDQFRDFKARAKARRRSLGMQVESEAELTALRKQVVAAEIPALDQANTACCYARSDKYWITDPQGIAWENFNTLESVPIYGDTSHSLETVCCSPTSKAFKPANSNTCCP